MQEKFMTIAYKLAQNVSDEIPVGAVIVKDNNIIAIATNKKEQNNDVTAHAEIVAIREAENFLRSWRLNECEIYVTLEPCPMCAWAIIQSGIKAVYFGAYDSLYGALGTKINLAKLANSKISIHGGIMEEKCDKLLKDFFKGLRDDNKK